MKKSLLILLFSLLAFTDSVNAAGWLGWRRLIDKPTFDIAVNPKNLNTFFAGGEGRLVYRSYDGGVNWDTLVVGFKWGSTIFNNLIMHPIDTNIILVGGLKFGMLARSTDHGKKWDYVISTTGSLELNGKSLMFKPDAPDTVYLGEFQKGIIMRSINKGKTWDSISRVMTTRTFKRADNSLYDTIISVPIGSTGIRDDSTNILLVGSTTGEMFMSSDGGFTWKKTAQFTTPDAEWTDCEITRITFSEQHPLVGFAVITYLFPRNTNNGGCYKTTDGGYNWERIAFKDTSLWAVSVRGYGNEDEVFVGGYTEDFYAHDTLRVPGVGIVRRSQDGGKTWWSYDQHIDWAYRDPKANARMTCVYFRPNSDTGFVCGLHGYLLKTVDKGENWNEVNFPFQLGLRGIQFVDEKTGIVVGDEGKIFRSKNGGWQWTEVNSGFNENLMSVFYKDKKTVFACGSAGLIISSADSGKKWVKINSGTIDTLNRIYFTSENIGYAAGTNGMFLKTIDGGNTWQELDLKTSASINSFSALDDNILYAVGFSGLILKSIDGGGNWSQLTSGTQLNLRDIACINKNPETCVIAGDSGLVIKTINGGSLWEPQKTFTFARNFYAIGFANANVGAVAGQWGSIINTSNSGDNWWIRLWSGGPWANQWSLRFLGPLGQEKLYMAGDAGLFVLDFPSYVEQFKDESDPNLKVAALPDCSIFFEYLTKRSSQVDVSVFDLLGNEIFRKSYIPTGLTVSDVIHPNIPASGIYFIRVREDGYVSQKKFLCE